MFEIDDPVRRDRALAKLGRRRATTCSCRSAASASRAIADPTRENTTADGKASSVQFLRFPFTPAQKARFRDAGTPVMVGIDHPEYGHMAVMPEATRAALAEDLS